MLIFFYFLLGSVAGFLSGLLGVGGGMTIVPTLLFLFTRFLGLSDDLAMHLAIGTSLATIILTAIFSTRAHHKRGAVSWPLFKSFAPGIILGSLIVGPVISLFLSGQILRIIFAIFCLFMALQMIISLKQSELEIIEPQNFFRPAIIIGAVSSILGIAGGSLAAALLNWYRYSMRYIIGTTAAIGIPVAICGTLGFIVTGWHLAGLPKWSSGYIYWPAFLGIVLGSSCTAPMGAYLAHKLPIPMLKKIFATMLMVIGIQLFFR